MTTLETMGEAQLLAHEGQRQMAAALAKLVKRAFFAMIEAITRSAPNSFVP